ncbi:ribonuclease pancreatic-like [Python bivittatus]|uniref:Ribonuclease pancreatic-like n=1 Tax=Python bivittatus TaxID=176946 RepID=A0A9F5MW03_PYTBI|nr:ribonuclease pancreatic-like [Python bivittatus]
MIFSPGRFLESPAMLTSKISLLVSLAVLLGVLVVQPSQGQTWANFQRKHIDYPKSKAPNPNAYCNRLMKMRQMTEKHCKIHNTFINNAPENVQQMCQGSGSHSVIDSRVAYPMIDCHYLDGKPPNDCEYQGTQQVKHICVTCENNLPVHFNQIIP